MKILSNITNGLFEYIFVERISIIRRFRKIKIKPVRDDVFRAHLPLQYSSSVVG